MAVAQAQHVVKELGDLLENNDCEVSYGIHLVAGRMPGHVECAFAEANFMTICLSLKILTQRWILLMWQL